jgi:hypothetical protein
MAKSMEEALIAIKATAKDASARSQWVAMVTI